MVKTFARCMLFIGLKMREGTDKSSLVAATAPAAAEHAKKLRSPGLRFRQSLYCCTDPRSDPNKTCQRELEHVAGVGDKNTHAHIDLFSPCMDAHAQRHTARCRPRSYHQGCHSQTTDEAENGRATINRFPAVPRPASE